eukprot:gene15028-10748_t
MSGLRASIVPNGNIPLVFVNGNRDETGSKNSSGTPRGRGGHAHRHQSMTSGKLTIKLPSSDIPSTRVSFAVEQMQMVPASAFNTQASFLLHPELPVYIERPNLPPVHRASGEQSVMMGSDDPRKHGHHRRRSLWNSTNEDALATVEAAENARIEAEQIAAELAAEEAAAANGSTPSKPSSPLLPTNRPPSSRPRAESTKSNHSDGEHRADEAPAMQPASPERVDEDGDLLSPLTPAPGKSPSPSKFKDRDVRRQLMARGSVLLSSEENQEVSDLIDATLHEWTVNKTRDQLHTLRKYVMGHTRRKIVANWNMIENRFKTSAMHKATMVVDRHGLEAPLKQPAVYASALASVLCSSRVKIGHRELSDILSKLGADEEAIFLARRIAAHHVVIGICQEAKSDLALAYTDDMQRLLRAEHFLVGQRDFEDLVFADDPDERKKELDAVHANRHAEVQQMLEEKKKREEKRDQIAAGRRKLIDEFEKILAQIQLLKAPMNVARVELFRYVVEECRVAIRDFYEEQTSKVPMDLLSFLGVDAFPAAVQNKLRQRLGRANMPKAASAAARGMAPPTLSRTNSQLSAAAGGGNFYGGPLGASADSLESSGAPSTAPARHAARRRGLRRGHRRARGPRGPRRRLRHEHQTRRPAPPPAAAASKPPLRARRRQRRAADERVTHQERKQEALMAKRKAQLSSPTATSGGGSIMSCLRGMVAIGKTFPGVSYREAVEMLQYVAVTKIATTFRGFRRRWRFMSARFKWRAKFRVVAHRHFAAWATLIATFVELREHCWRKLKAWRFYTRYTRRRRESFRVAFWPLHTWRKYATASRVAKEKTTFLVGRVLPTVLSLRVFRAWRDYTRRECELTQRARACAARKLRARARDALQFLRFWAFQRRRIRSAWFRRGQSMRTRNIVRLRCQSLQIWRAFAWLRRYTRERVRSEFWWIKQTLLAGRAPLRRKSLTDRRLLASTKRHGGGETALMNRSMNKMRANMSKKTSLVGNNARKIVSPQVAAGGDADLALQRVLDECRRRRQRPFSWRSRDARLDSVWDADSDGEDDEDLPPMLRQLYAVLAPKMAPFEDVYAQPFILSPFDAAQRRAEQRRDRRRKLKAQAKLVAEQRQRYAARVAELRPPRGGADARQTVGSVAPAVAAAVSAATRRAAATDAAATATAASDANAAAAPPTGAAVAVDAAAAADDAGAGADGDGDVASDDDDDAFAARPPSVLSQFATPLLQLSTHPPDVGYIARKHFDAAQRAYETRDVWNLFDAAWRFHRFGHLAFHNLRQYARVKHRVRLFRQKRRQRWLGACWATWRDIVETARRLNAAGGGGDGDGDAADGSLDGAEALVYRMRAQHTAKVSRTRKISDEVRLHATRLEDDAEEAQRRHVQRMKNLNLVDDDDDDYLRRQRLAALQRIAENKARLAQQWLHGYVPPNLLELDRRDRLRELQLMRDMLRFGERLRGETTRDVAASDARHAAFERHNALIGDMVGEVLEQEGAVTEAAVQRQLDYAAHFKEHAADLLLSTLAKVREEVLTALLKAESKIYFRALRLPMLIARSHRMYSRKVLRNHLRLCRRLAAIDRLAPFYYAMRRKWLLFNAWLQHVERAKLHPSAGFARSIRRRLALHPDFHRTLQARGFISRAYTEDARLRAVASEFAVVFSRWKMYTQESVLFRMMHERVTKLVRLATLRKFFWGLRHQLSVLDPAHERQMRATLPTCFPMLQLRADLDQITKRFIPLRKKLLPQTIRSKNARVIHRRKADSKDGLTFKKFLAAFAAEVSVRISLEQRLLFEAFEDRGGQQFVHRRVPESRTDDAQGLVPVIMSKLEAASEFADPRDEDVVPGGFRLAKLKFAMVIDDGFVITSSAVLGWQLLWTAEGCTEIESKPRGLWHAAGMTVQEIVVPKDDFVVGVEYLYDGAAMVAVRCRFFRGGWSRWAGGKTSLSTLSVYLPCDAGPLEDFEAERLLTEDERRSPALPYAFVMGLTGLVYHQRVTCLGLIVRKVRRQGLFAYHWVQDRLEQRRLDEGTAASGALDQLPSVAGVESLPSAVDVANPLADKGAAEARRAAAAAAAETDQPLYGPQAAAAAAQRLHSADGGGVVGTEERGGVDNDVIPMGESLTLSHAPDDLSRVGFESLPQPLGRGGGGGGGFDDGDGDDGDSDEEHDVFADDAASGAAGSATATGASAFQTFDEDGNVRDDVLTRAEQQFFDTIRMRMTELAAAKQRVVDFARFLWSTPTLRGDGDLKRLLTLRIITGLARWLFNALSRRLLPVCGTEKQGLRLAKQGRRALAKGKGLCRQAARYRDMAAALEQRRMPWTGKGLLAPAERAAKKEHLATIAALLEQVRALDEEGAALQERGAALQKAGERLMPRLSLSAAVYDNFRHKVAAARHKETLLERMTIDDVKKGLFGANMKETLLNRDQMQAIHASLRDRKIELKDTTSLQRLLADVLADEAATRDADHARRLRERRQQTLGCRWGAAPLLSQSASLSRLPPPRGLDPREHVSLALQSPSGSREASTAKRQQHISRRPSHGEAPSQLHGAAAKRRIQREDSAVSLATLDDSVATPTQHAATPTRRRPRARSRPPPSRAAARQK